MSNPLKQSLRKTSHSFLALTILLVFSFTLSGCGGGGGGGQEPMNRELMLSRINEIQETERSNIRGDDVARDILQTAVNSPIGGHFSSLSGTIASSTTQDSSSSRDLTRPITNRRSSRGLTIRPEYDTDGMLHFTTSLNNLNTGDSTILRTTDPGVTLNRVEGIPAANWKGVEFQGEDTEEHYNVDIFSDIENNEDTDYLFMAFWLQETKVKSDTLSNYGLAIAAGGNDPFDVNNRAAGLTGMATYEGPATGLYMMKADAAAAPVFDYFNAKASLTADFGDATALGNVSGTITKGMTEEGRALPDITLGSADIMPNRSSSGRGGNYFGDASGMTAAGVAISGKWGGKFYGNGAGPPNHPGSAAGTFGAKTADDLQAIVGAFAAHKN